MNNKFLISLLTSSMLEYLEESFKSVINQHQTDLEYDVLIMVNTLKKNYFQEVKEWLDKFTYSFSGKVFIEESESNGKPGKGHNSVLTYFKKHEEYDFILTFDGDDFIYPCALQNINNYLQYSPDILMLPFSDILNSQYSKTLGIPLREDIYLNFNNYSKTMVQTWKKHKLSPFDHHIQLVNTAGRLIFVSRKGIELNLHYDENMGLFDDVHIFLQVFEASVLKNDLNVFILFDYDILLYNRLNQDSVTVKLDKKIIDIQDENQHLVKSIQNKFYPIRDWDLGRLKYLTNRNCNESFTLTDKIHFSDKLIQQFNYKGNPFIQDVPINLYQIYALENNDDSLYREYEKRKIKYLTNLLFFHYNNEKDELLTFMNQFQDYKARTNIENFDICIFTEHKFLDDIRSIISPFSISVKIQTLTDFHITNIFSYDISNYYAKFLYIHLKSLKENVFIWIENQLFEKDIRYFFYVLQNKGTIENRISKLLIEHVGNDLITIQDACLFFTCNIMTHKSLLLMKHFQSKNQHLSLKEILNLILIKNNMFQII